jgi:SAM-dependent methyltransferase
MESLVFQGGRVIDFGGFDGLMATQLRTWGAAEVIVLDLNMQGVLSARQRGLSAILGSASEAPFASGSADAVFCLDMIEHVNQDRSVIQEIARVLRPGGRVLLTTTSDDFHLPLVSRQWLNRLWGHVRNGYSDADLKDLCASAGLKIIRRGRYFNTLSRLFYSLFFIYRFPPFVPGLKLRMFRAIARLEPHVGWGALEHWVVAERPARGLAPMKK